MELRSSWHFFFFFFLVLLTGEELASRVSFLFALLCGLNDFGCVLSGLSNHFELVWFTVFVLVFYYPTSLLLNVCWKHSWHNNHGPHNAFQMEWTHQQHADGPSVALLLFWLFMINEVFFFLFFLQPLQSNTELLWKRSCFVFNTKALKRALLSETKWLRLLFIPFWLAQKQKNVEQPFVLRQCG